MKMYDLATIMKRAHNIKNEAGCTFSQALKFSWAIEKKEIEIRVYNSRFDGENVTWSIWTGYGKVRAYYKCSWRSKYADSKNTNFINM
jgi:hypothetical protein